MILLVDNYDSFTFNVADLLAQKGAEVRVVRNDAISIAEAEEFRPTHLVVSPGPGRPEAAGESLPLIRNFAGKIPVLGICLGHQALAMAFGGRIVHGRPYHGKTSEIHHDGKGLFRGLPLPFPATRYHSLVVEEQSLPSCFEITARTPEGEIMGIRHRDLPLVGVQFHPESILTEAGGLLLANFLEFC